MFFSVQLKSLHQRTQITLSFPTRKDTKETNNANKGNEAVSNRFSIMFVGRDVPIDFLYTQLVCSVIKTQLLEAPVTIREMDILREFLESSTIHGLAHISTSRSKRAKLAWFICVLVSFSIAIFLIWKTTKEIQDDPFSTAITTHPIGELDFPMVTICPPKGTNTAINNGLMKAKKPLTEKQKEQLKNATRKIFIDEPFLDFSNFLFAVANKANIRKMCEAFQSIPKPMSSSGLEIRTNALSGSLTSSGYNEGKTLGQARTKVHYVIELPSNGSLNLQLKVEANGIVEYKEGSVFKYVSKGYSFDNAIAQCGQLGGQLASLHSKEELEEVRRVADSNLLSQRGSWLGATFNETSEKWGWIDGSPWDWEDWDVGQPNRTCGSGALVCGNCLRMNTTSWKLRTFRCTRSTDVLCKMPPTVLEGEVEKKIEFNVGEANLFIFHLRWTPAKEGALNDGFSMNWTISTENNNGQGVSDIYNTVLVRMVNLAKEARRMNMTKATLRSEVINSKARQIGDGNYTLKQCHRGRVEENMFILDKRAWHFQDGLSVEIEETDVFNSDTTEEDLETGFELFSWLIFCPEELQLLYQFHMELLTTKNVQTILQTTVNNMKSGKIKEKSNIELVKTFFSELDNIVSTDLGKIVLALSSKMDIEKVLEDNMPYTKLYDEKSIQDCMKYNNCQILSDVIQDLGEDSFCCS